MAVALGRKAQNPTQQACARQESPVAGSSSPSATAIEGSRTSSPDVETCWHVLNTWSSAHKDEPLSTPVAPSWCPIHASLAQLAVPRLSPCQLRPALLHQRIQQGGPAFPGSLLRVGRLGLGFHPALLWRLPRWSFCCPCSRQWLCSRRSSLP